MSNVLDLTCELIRRRSVTPDDAGCQALIADRLRAAGFGIEQLPFGDVRNLWATHGSGGAPVLMLLGHTDVVPAGPREDWQTDPFEPVVRDGVLYGRGAADMKGSVAAMVCALEAFVAAYPDHDGTVALLLTSDEEGEAIHGVRSVAECFRATAQRVDYCLVGEPSSSRTVGDTVKVGRRGSLSGALTVHGVQGHVAYPDKADNPIHRFAPALLELSQRQWDAGSADFPPTRFQVSNIAAGTGANNVIPGALEVQFNLRFSTAWTSAALRAEIESVLQRHGLRFDLRWHVSGEPFLTAPGALRDAVRDELLDRLGQAPEESTVGGTSDGRFIAPLGAEVVELGPVNASIHKVDECVRVDALDVLADCYAGIARRLLVTAEAVAPGSEPSSPT
ncbi:succinyl-diaminopimelate desuccinylase [Chiayiivirga flava]|uniref:Succinyl-diaminopimelate desuccinylase n=1 Tax=Chiayiivirga flava TaxID=659595 RepID=A0A7W8FZJ0_9GAMM|nr:succinyl-diaminopimelate desuccinylase [Chiayiivirga flava]MBB5208537.1 succinyl-diaminopimelate desuccinylase [Chiayiivirga flava]